MPKSWRKKGEAFLPKNTVPKLKHGGVSMMFSGCFSSRGMGQLIIIRGIMKSEDYIRILDENLQLSAQNSELCWRFTSEQDNDSKHMSESVTAWLQKKNITLLLWPSMSPDLNPIENHWQKLKVRINRRSPKSLQELERVSIEEWEKNQEKICLNRL